MSQILRGRNTVAATWWRHRAKGSCCSRAVVTTGSDS